MATKDKLVNLEDLKVPYDELSAEIGDLKSALSTFLIGSREIVVDQLFDKTTVTSGKYVSYSDGRLYNNADYTVSDYIEIDPQKKYEIVGSNNTQMAMYDASKQFVSGFVKNSEFNSAPSAGTIPSNVKYIMTCFVNASLNNIQVNEYGTEYFYNNRILTLIDGKIIVTVGGDGADYADLKSCFEDITPTKDVRVEVRLNPGTYDLRQLYDSSVLTNTEFYGLFIPDYVDLVGVAGAESTIITWDGSSDASNTKISTLNIRNDCTIKGVTISCDNIRYAVHDDFATNGEYNYRYIKDCIIESSNVTLTHIYGAGEKGNADWTFENVEFIGYPGANAFFMHNNTNHTIESVVRFINCRFVGPNAGAALFASMTNGLTAFTHLFSYGCKYRNAAGDDTKITFVENSAATQGAGMAFKLSGYYNKYSEVNITVTDGQDYSSYIDLI